MKKVSLFALAAAGLLLGACSSDDAVVQTNPNGDFTDGAYIGIALQLPSATATTRANEDFEDGEDDEFAVKNATLYLFEGDTEAAATYMAQYAIGTAYNTDGGANITSTYNEATLIDNETADLIKNNEKNVYAYVIVNHNGLIPALDKSVTFADFSKWEFAAFGSPVAEEKKISDEGLLMTNSPISDVAGGAAEPSRANYTTLVQIDKEKIFSTAELAKSSPAACIYVERAAVKVTVSSTVAAKATVNDVPVTILGWQIFNYEPTFYNTRQVDAAWGPLATDANKDVFTQMKAANLYRFVSGTAFDPQIPAGADHTDGYRTYFAKDVNYNVAKPVLAKTQAPADGTWIALDKSGYTSENTFDVERMDWQNTTQVAVKAQFNGGEDFYTINGGNDIYKADVLKTYIATSITNLPAVNNALKAVAKALADQDGTNTYTGTLAVNFTEPAASKDGFDYTVSYSFTGGTVAPDDLTDQTTVEALDDLIEAAQASFVPSFHKGGLAYYNVRIKHFGEYETPWSSTEPFATVVPGLTIPQIYGTGDDATKRFLGRYGVVRDNWYKLTISDVKKIGTAEPVDVRADPTPDDEIENYISVHVHILPWVIRNQDVVL